MRSRWSLNIQFSSKADSRHTEEYWEQFAKHMRKFNLTIFVQYVWKCVDDHLQAADQNCCQYCTLINTISKLLARTSKCTCLVSDSRLRSQSQRREWDSRWMSLMLTTEIKWKNWRNEEKYNKIYYLLQSMFTHMIQQWKWMASD
jgi:hypothetical protein